MLNSPLIIKYKLISGIINKQTDIEGANMQVDHITVKNNKTYNKPNEDYFLVDDSNKIFMVVDGVSRDLVKGVYPKPSPAHEAAKLLTEETYSYLLCNIPSLRVNPLSTLKNSIIKGNNALQAYNKTLNNSFLAGVVGIFAFLHNQKLYYAYIGDSIGILIRDNKILSFTEQQTELIRVHKAKYTKEQIRNDICNNESHPYCYGVLNGQESAINILKTGSIELLPNDIIILATDGFESIINNTFLPQLKTFSLKQLVKIVEDLELKNNFTDDKTVIKISKW